jgi:hypothetical protein
MFCRSVRVNSQRNGAVGLAIKNGYRSELRHRIPRCARFNADDTLLAFLAFALIFRDPLDETQAQSQFASDTRNIQQLGISEIKVRLGLPRIIQPKENAPESDYSSIYE